MQVNKKALSERGICTKFINPVLELANWDLQAQAREDASFTAARIIVRGHLNTRGKRRRAGYVLSYKQRTPILEAKDNTRSMGDCMQQALAYNEVLDAPFVFSNNGDSPLFHDRTGLFGKNGATLGLTPMAYGHHLKFIQINKE